MIAIGTPTMFFVKPERVLKSIACTVTVPKDHSDQRIGRYTPSLDERSLQKKESNINHLYPDIVLN